MPFKEKIERIIKFLLNECLPPIIRERRTLMRVLLRLAFGDKGKNFLRFREYGGAFGKSDLREIYSQTQNLKVLQQESDLSDRVIEQINASVIGEEVLDVGGGNGVLANSMQKDYSVSVCDLVLQEKVVEKLPDIEFKEGNVEALPYQDSQFDTVISTNTLEHVPDIHAAVRELRRVAKKRIIVVLPIERPYLYTFNLHLHFFPYEFSVRCLFAPTGNSAHSQTIKRIKDRWFYLENMI